MRIVWGKRSREDLISVVKTIMNNVNLHLKLFTIKYIIFIWIHVIKPLRNKVLNKYPKRKKDKADDDQRHLSVCLCSPGPSKSTSHPDEYFLFCKMIREKNPGREEKTIKFSATFWETSIELTFRLFYSIYKLLTHNIKITH